MVFVINTQLSHGLDSILGPHRSQSELSYRAQSLDLSLDVIDDDDVVVVVGMCFMCQMTSVSLSHDHQRCVRGQQSCNNMVHCLNFATRTKITGPSFTADSAVALGCTETV